MGAFVYFSIRLGNRGGGKIAIRKQIVFLELAKSDEGQSGANTFTAGSAVKPSTLIECGFITHSQVSEGFVPICNQPCFFKSVQIGTVKTDLHCRTAVIGLDDRVRAAREKVRNIMTRCNRDDTKTFVERMGGG